MKPFINSKEGVFGQSGDFKSSIISKNRTFSKFRNENSRGFISNLDILDSSKRQRTIICENLPENFPFE